MQPTFDRGDIIFRPMRHDPIPGTDTDHGSERPVVLRGHDFHSHDYPLLIHVVSGSVEINLRRGAVVEKVSLAAESNLWLAANVSHAVTARRDSIMLGPRLSPETEPPGGYLHLPRSPAIRETALLVLAASPADESERLPFRRVFDAALQALLGDDFFIPEAARRTVSNIVDDPVSLLIPLKELAARHAMSPRHLERLLKDELGLSFLAWRTRKRLNLALRRIRAGASVTAAARTVGYAGADGLIRAASRMTGLSRAELSGDPAAAVRARRGPADQPPSGIQAEPSSTR